MKSRDYIFISVLFYLGWFGSVLLAKTPNPLVSLLFPLALIGFLIVKKSLSLNDVKIAFAVTFVGLLFDGLMLYFGLVSAEGDSSFYLPAWLISVWLLFSFSMIKLGVKIHPPIWLAALLGAIMGPLSYKSGEYFQVFTFRSSHTFFIYSVFWAISFPIVLNSNRLWNRGQIHESHFSLSDQKKFNRKIPK